MSPRKTERKRKVYLTADMKRKAAGEAHRDGAAVVAARYNISRATVHKIMRQIAKQPESDPCEALLVILRLVRDGKLTPEDAVPVVRQLRDKE